MMHVRCSLDSPPIATTLARLHREARLDLIRFPSVLAREALARLRGQAGDAVGMAERFASVRIPLGTVAGRLAYTIGRSIAARNIVEFGTSFGISTLYLAAAVRDNGGGQVIGTELAESKWRAARSNLAEAGLADVVDVRLGDAMQTLQHLPESIDMVLLDGWKDLYLPVLHLLEPRLRCGGVVLADNVKMFKKDLAPYLRYVKTDSGRYVSTTLPIGTGLEYSLRV